MRSITGNHGTSRRQSSAAAFASILADVSPPVATELWSRRLLLERIGEVASAGEDFGFKTTLSGRTYARLLNGLKRDGYRVALFFLWLPSADLAVLRVANRVRQGGHAVPDADVRRRFASGLRNLFRLYRQRCDCWWLYDASRLPPALIAWKDAGSLTTVDADLFDRIQRNLGE